VFAIDMISSLFQEDPMGRRFWWRAAVATRWSFCMSCWEERRTRMLSRKNSVLRSFGNVIPTPGHLGTSDRLLAVLTMARIPLRPTNHYGATSRANDYDRPEQVASGRSIDHVGICCTTAPPAPRLSDYVTVGRRMGL